MASFVVRPSLIGANKIGVPLTLIGTGTAWTVSSVIAITNSLTGTTTVTKGTWTVSGPGAAQLTVTTGAGRGTWRLTIDGVQSGVLRVGPKRHRWFPGLSYTRRRIGA
jgi:hypothetical protein